MTTELLVDTLKALHLQMSFPKTVIYKNTSPQLGVSLDKFVKEVRCADFYICTDSGPEWPEYKDCALQIRIREHKIIAKHAMHMNMMSRVLLEDPVTTVLLIENRERLLQFVPMAVVNKLIVL